MILGICAEGNRNNVVHGGVNLSSLKEVLHEVNKQSDTDTNDHDGSIEGNSDLDMDMTLVLLLLMFSLVKVTSLGQQRLLKTL